MTEEYDLITPHRDSPLSTDRIHEAGYCTKDLVVEVEDYSTL